MVDSRALALASNITPAAEPSVLPTLSIAPSNAPAAEGNSGSTAYTFVVTRAGDTSSVSSVSWAVTGNGGSPANAADFSGAVLPAGQVQFAAGQTTATITVNVNGDSSYEPNEGFVVTLANPVGAVLAASVVDDSFSQSASGGFGVTENFYTLSAGGGVFTLNYDMYSIPDRADVYVNGVLAASTNGLVSDAGTLTVPSSISLPAGAQVRVVMTGTDEATLWDYTVEYQGGLQFLDYLAAGTILNDDAQTVPPLVAGSLGRDVMVPSAGNLYVGGAGNDLYLISSRTLSTAVTAGISDSEGINTVELVDGTVITSSTFYADAMELTLSTGAKLQVLGASKYVFHLGANTPGSDGTSDLTYTQLATVLGTTLPTGVTPTNGTPGYTVPTAFQLTTPPTPGTPTTSYLLGGTLDNDFIVPSANNRYLAGAGNDTYIISHNVLAGEVIASITDTEGVDVIQLVDGLPIASSLFFNDAVQLTLSTGASVQVLSAGRMFFQVGANVPGGDLAANLTFAQFAAMLGVTLPAAGGSPIAGTPNFTVPSNTPGLFTVSFETPPARDALGSLALMGVAEGAFGGLSQEFLA